MTAIEIENKFTYHKPKPEQQNKYVILREKAKELAYLIAEHCPQSDERDMAIIKLQEVIMFANASIAIHT